MAEIKKRFEVESDLVEGRGGVYRIWADGRLIWDKHEAGRFPEDGEIVGRIASMAKEASP